jgi:hypothetical protein
MKDRLKDFVDGNRQAFDDREPPESVWKNITSSLPGMRQRSLWNSVAVWRAAAILFLALSSYFFMTRTTIVSGSQKAASLVEFTDLESFYSSQIAEKVALISDFDAVGESDPFTEDFQKLDAMYQVLREEMKHHPSDQVRDALVLNLLVRIDLLNRQIKKLEDSRKPLKAKASVA